MTESVKSDEELLKALDEHPEVPIKHGKVKIRVRGGLTVKVVSPEDMFEVVKE